MNSHSKEMMKALKGQDGVQEVPSVAILMCTYNGEEFISEQLDSLREQSYLRSRLYISDDGSTDATLEKIRQFSSGWEAARVEVFEGPRQGFAKNFLSISCNKTIQADYYAWCDQDDVWHEDKLKAAIDRLSSVPAGIPALYCGRTELVDVAGQHLGFSPLFSRSANFANALVQNIAGGNTMVFNDALMRIMREVGDQVPIVSHDWWAYLITTGCGGVVVYDAVPTMLYRQHSANCVGANAGLAPNLKRVQQLFRGRFKSWMNQNLEALQAVSHTFTPDNQRLLAQFTDARRASLLRRFFRVRRSGVYRQTLLGNVGLGIAAILGRI